MSFLVTPTELARRAELYAQLSAMIAAGVPLIKALEMTGREGSVRGARKTIQQLIQHLNAGHTFTDSMRQVQGGWMSEFDVALLSVGEQSGRLDVSFKLLSKNYETRAKIIHDTISGMITTVLTLHVFLLIFPITMMVNFVVKGLINGQYSQCTPFIIEKIVIFSSLYGAVLFLIFACQGKRGEKWRAIMETFFQMFPLLGKALRYLTISRLASALDALTNAGMDVPRSWEMAAAAAGSPALRRQISNWRNEIEAGRTPAELVNESGYFPEMFCNLYQSGEISGKLDEALERLQAYYQEEGFRLMTMFTRIMNRGIYMIVVALVAYNIIGFYTNYFNQALNI